MRHRNKILAGIAAAAVVVGGVFATTATGQAQFGTDEDIAYAVALLGGP